MMIFHSYVSLPEGNYIYIYVGLPYFNGFHKFFPWFSPWFSHRIASQATFWPVKLHRVVVVRASDWEALGFPEEEHGNVSKAIIDQPFGNGNLFVI